MRGQTTEERCDGPRPGAVTVRAPWPSGLVMAAALLLVAGVRPSEPPVPPRSVVLITIDTMRADHLGAYGHARDTTPNIDRFAATATRFDRAFATRGLTLPAVASIMTGQYPYRHGVVDMYQARLPDSAVTLAERLRHAGFTTAAFSSHLGIARDTGFDQGFDGYRLFHSDDEAKMAREAARWLWDHRDERIFVWYHSFGPHSPYQAPEPWRHRYTDPDYAGPYTGDQKQMYEIPKRRDFTDADREHLIALYDGKVRWIDHHLGRVLKTIETSGLADHALVILSADHGEELFDHFPYFSHEGSIHDGVLRIPLLVRLPGQRAPRVVESLTQQVSIAPTILDLLGLAGSAGMQGRSFKTAVEGGRIAPEVAFGTVDHPERTTAVRTVRTERWRYVRNRSGYRPALAVSYPREALYDLDGDADATRDVLAERPRVARDLRARLDSWVAENPVPPKAGRTSPETARRLRMLGYVEDPARREAAETP